MSVLDVPPPRPDAGVWHLDRFQGTDDQKMAAALAAWEASPAGGTIVLGARDHVMLNAWQPASGSFGGALFDQKPLRITGQGAGASGAWSSFSGGTTVDMRYNGSAPAKIDTRGNGLIEIDRIHFKDTADTKKPFFQTTNTVAKIHDCAFTGTTTGYSADQDAIVLGGTTTTLGGGPNAAFAGYGGVIRDNFFDRIRRGVWGRTYVNSVPILGNTFSASCGGNASAAAIHIDGTVGFANGNYIVGNLIEMVSYVWGIRYKNSSENISHGNAFWDPHEQFQGCYLLEGSTANTFSNTMHEVVQGIDPAKWVVDQTSPGGSLYTFQTGQDVIGATLAGGHDRNVVRPAVATGNENARLLVVARALDEASNGGAVIYEVRQNGAVYFGGAWSSGAGFAVRNSDGAGGSTQTYYDHRSIVRDQGDLELYPGGDQPYRKVVFKRGVLGLPTYTTAQRPSAAGAGGGSGTGAMIYDTTLNKPLFSDGANWRDAAGNLV